MDDLLAVRLDKPLADALDARAAQTRQTRSEVARDLLRQGLAAV
ncbi:MAG: ribbon-helix-helix protein, CopG family [Bifidobacteriaceae bacterium]|jgi:metal-responsive CopG/Arc/MetJ family transcriptional regulator|nr:ribbon-helix-helix protein, CopG family [Bifidobacteriaceae bacterium]